MSVREAVLGAVGALTVIASAIAQAQYRIPLDYSANPNCAKGACKASAYFRHAFGATTSRDWACGSTTYCLCSKSEKFCTDECDPTNGDTCGSYDCNPSDGTCDLQCHKGTDFKIGWTEYGKSYPSVPAVAAANGTVVKVIETCGDTCTHCCQCEENPGYGNEVRVIDDFGRVNIYGHLRKDSVIVELGDYVWAGDKIGEVGSSGCSSGPHVHFEVRVDGVARDPFAGACSDTHNDWSDMWLDQGTEAGLPSVDEYAEEWMPGQLSDGLHVSGTAVAGLEALLIPLALCAETLPVPVITKEPVVSREFQRAYGYRKYINTEDGSPVPLLGLPTATPGSAGHFVHEWDGLWIQDFYQSDPSLRFSGSDGYTVLVYNAEAKKVFLLRSGFWGTYKTTSPAGPTLLGPPRSNEFAWDEGACQLFERGSMTWDGKEVVVYKDADGDVQCASGTKYCVQSNWDEGATCEGVVQAQGDLCLDTEAACGDGSDDDCNGLTDEEDPACASGAGAEVVCGDGLDNDSDGIFDAADLDCGSVQCQSGAQEMCNGQDDDVEACTNGTDDDADNWPDCADSECSCAPSCDVPADHVRIVAGTPGFTPTAKMRAARKVQGQYLGRLKKLTGADRAKVKATAKKEGVAAAVKMAEEILKGGGKRRTTPMEKVAGVVG